MKKLFLVLTALSLSHFSFSDEWNNFLEIGQPAERMEFSLDIKEEENIGYETDDYEAAEFILKNAQNYYELGDSYFDQEAFESAFENYKKCASIMSKTYWILKKSLNENSKNFINKENGKILYKGNTFQLLYYSLYNMACCKCKLKDYESTRQYLYYAVLAGYPHINYILKDEDMKEYFLNSRNAKNELLKWQNAGNSNSIVAGKVFTILIFNGGQQVELYTDGTYKIEDKDAYGWYEVHGTYSVKNFVLTFNFLKEIVHKRNNVPIEKAKSIDELYYPDPIVRGNAGNFKISLWCIEYPDGGLDDGIFREKKRNGRNYDPGDTSVRISE